MIPRRTFYMVAGGLLVIAVVLPLGLAFFGYGLGPAFVSLLSTGTAAWASTLLTWQAALLSLGVGLIIALGLVGVLLPFRDPVGDPVVLLTRSISTSDWPEVIRTIAENKPHYMIAAVQYTQENEETKYLSVSELACLQSIASDAFFDKETFCRLSVKLSSCKCIVVQYKVQYEKFRKTEGDFWETQSKDKLVINMHVGRERRKEGNMRMVVTRENCNGIYIADIVNRLALPEMEKMDQAVDSMQLMAGDHVIPIDPNSGQYIGVGSYVDLYEYKPEMKGTIVQDGEIEIEIATKSVTLS